MGKSIAPHSGDRPELAMGECMEKTDRQTVLGLQRGQPIDEIIEQTLEKHRGKRHYAALAAMELGLAGATLYKWAEALGIDIGDYRRRKTLTRAGTLREDLP